MKLTCTTSKKRCKQSGFGDEFHYRGVLDREQKISFLQTLDVLSVPATYDEPRECFCLKAMACGVPVVTTTTRRVY